MTDDKRCLETGPASFGNISEENTKKLLQKCKEEKTSCHAALIAAAHIVLAQFENDLSTNSVSTMQMNIFYNINYVCRKEKHGNIILKHLLI